MRIEFEKNTLVVYANPFKFELAVDGVPAVSWNERGYFYHEAYRKRDDHGKEPAFAKRSNPPEPVPEGEQAVSPSDSDVDSLNSR
jgi:alpha 1,3-glucosidase